MKRLLTILGAVICLNSFAQLTMTSDSLKAANAPAIELMKPSCCESASMHMDNAGDSFKTAGLFYVMTGLGVLLMNPVDNSIDKGSAKYFAAASLVIAGTFTINGARELRKAKTELEK